MSEELKLINGGIAGDDRGYVRFVNDFDPVKAGVRRFYQVENHRAGFIRAFHGHLKEAKYVYVARGAATVVAVEMIKNSAGLTLLQEEVNKFNLISGNPKVLYIPPGYANGFKTLTDDTVLMFFSTSTVEESKGDDYRFDYDLIPSVWEEDFR